MFTEKKNKQEITSEIEGLKASILDNEKEIEQFRININSLEIELNN